MPAWCNLLLQDAPTQGFHVLNICLKYYYGIYSFLSHKQHDCWCHFRWVAANSGPEHSLLYTRQRYRRSGKRPLKSNKTGVTSFIMVTTLCYSREGRVIRISTANHHPLTPTDLAGALGRRRAKLGHQGDLTKLYRPQTAESVVMYLI